MPLVNLHRHSMWSILDGSGTGEQYATRAAELGQGALALTDHGTLAGALEHVQACDEVGIMPILGVEAYFRESRLDRVLVDSVDKNGKKIKKLPKRFHLTLLAMNHMGWVNLQRLTSEAYATGLIDGRDRPCMDWDLLVRHREGVYCLAGCFASILSQDILSGGARVDEIVGQLRSIFADNLSLELMPHDWDEQRQLNIDNVNVSNQYGIPMAATGDTHYPYKSWASTQDIMVMLNTGQSNLIRKKKRDTGEEVYSLLKENPTLYLMGEDDMAGEFARYHPLLPADTVKSAIGHTTEIISGFTPFLLDRGIKMPKITRRVIAQIDEWDGQAIEDAEAFNGPDWLDEPDDDLVRSTLRKWCEEGLQKLIATYPAHHWFKFPVQVYRDRMEMELGVFNDIGDHVTRYMLMTGGEVRWAKRDGIIVGPGRGSAAGTIVAYLIGLTGIDPIPYDLKFERFINVNRKGMPDIDIDFMPGARGVDRVIAHTASVYGEKNVIPIAAFGTYGPKSAIRAVCRVFDDEIDPARVDRYAKVLDQLKPTEKPDLEECAERFTEIAEFKRLYPQLWEQATRIEGHPYSESEHASGVLVKPASFEIPTATRLNDDKTARYTVTAWPDTRELLAGYGLLKIDYLVINGLVRQYEILKALREREGTPIDLDTLAVRFDPEAVDERVMRRFGKGDTLGIWQLMGRGTIPVLKAVRPSNMHDLAAINALIRPGARGGGITDEYAKRKHGLIPESEWYWHESVEEVLKKTYGLMVYQEQAMAIVQTLGGFTAAEADDFRKAMGKKYREGIAAVVKFVRGLGFEEKWMDNASAITGSKLATTIWQDRLLKLGGYAFNACMTGDTVVCRGGAGKNNATPEITVEDLWSAQESSTQWGKKIRAGKVHLTQMDADGRIRIGKLKRVIHNGVKPVFRVLTWDGRHIDVTANHRLMTPDGYKRVDELRVGSYLVVEGEREPYASGRRTGVGRGFSKGGTYSGGAGFKIGVASHSWIDGRTGTLADAKSLVADRAKGGCEFCGRQRGDSSHSLEFAHQRTLESFQGSYALYHSSDNIRLLCNSCHKSLDYAKGERRKRWTRGKPTSIDMVVSIEYVGDQPVYDIEMDTTEHNFVANGIVSHNSHAYAYGLISYHDGLLKEESPADFYAWLLTFTKSTELSSMLSATMREGADTSFKVKPPDINLSNMGFKVVDKQTALYGLEAVKGLGPVGVKTVFEHRPYSSFEEFAKKVPAKAVNKNAKMALIGCGAFDEFGMRAMMTEREKESNEDAYIGIRLSGKSEVQKHAKLIEETIHTEEEFDEALDGAFLCVGGEVVEVNKKVDVKGKEMGWVNLAYGADQYRVTCFSNTWSRYQHLFVPRAVIFFEGKKQVSDKYGESFMANEVVTIDALVKMKEQAT